MRALLVVLLLLGALLSHSVRAASNYTATYPEYDPSQNQLRDVTAGYKTLDQFVNGLKELSSGSVFGFDLSIRGLSASLSTDGPLFLQLDIPSLGISQFFTASTAEENFENLRRFLTQGDQASRLQRELARTSPFDPVAGNPTSLMARAVAHDFNSAFSAFATNIMEGQAWLAQASGALPPGAAPRVFRPNPGVGGAYGNFHDQGLTAQSVTIPLSLTVRSDLDPRRQFAVSLPLTLTNVEGAMAYSGLLGASFRLPIVRPWALTGSLGYSRSNANDFGINSQIVSASITSSFQIRTTAADIAIGNMVGYYKTLKTSDVDPKISNTVFRNGVMVSHPAPAFLGAARSVEYSLVNTYYAGTDLYLNTYNEIGIAVGNNKRADSVRTHLQGNLTYLFSSKTKGLMLGLGYWF
jgi:hypothetical protein